MSEPASNPYIDETLMNAYVAYSPSENAKYLQQHTASKNTQAIAASRTQQPIAPITQYPFHANSHPQQRLQNTDQTQTESMPDQMIDEEFVGIPIGDGIGDELPLSYQELSTLRDGDILYILQDCEEECEEGWARVTFVGLDEDGFRVKTNICINGKSDAFEEIFYNTFCDDDMPVIYKENAMDFMEKMTQNMDISGEHQKMSENLKKDFILSHFAYDIGANIFVYDDANNFVFYTIERYDAQSSKAVLRDKSGCVSTLYLRDFKHESADSQSKAIAIVESDKKMNDSFIAIESINADFTWIKRTNTMKLKWISYKNSLLGTIAVATKHLYPISLDYKSLNFMSGIGLGFNWFYSSEYDGCDMSVIEAHMKLFLCDSGLDSALAQISKYSFYKFERFSVSEILHSTTAVQRLMELEQSIIHKLNRNICSITNDEKGHLALIVGFVKKAKRDSSHTMYHFKVKKFGAYTDSKYSKEYIAVDLCHQKIVITMAPPAKEKKFSFSHSFNPAMLCEIVTDLICDYELNECSKEMDLFGRNALVQMRTEMEIGSNTKETVSNRFAQESVYALIRLFDSRKTMLEMCDCICGKIKNAFHSQTGSESEWKFEPKSCDITPELKAIESCLKRETNCVRRQQRMFEKYILNYNGSDLGVIEWETHDRAGIKAALDEIIADEDQIFENLKRAKQKLLAYLKK